MTTERDRPASKPRVKAKGQPMAGWDHSVCWCQATAPKAEAGEVVA